MNTQLFVLCIIFGSMYWLYAMSKIKVSDRDRRYNAEETEIIQELHRGLEKMGQRIDALETILMDQSERFRQTPPPVPPREAAGRY